MTPYTEAVQQIVDDYLERLRLDLGALPTVEREEFVQEIRSHIYEAFQQEPIASEVARILAVLRKLGEPSEVIAGRLPESVVRSGRARKAPLYALGGIVLALFGIPLGVGGAAFLAGILATLASALAMYYAFTGAVLFTAVLFMGFGLMRLFLPDIWAKLHAEGRVIEMGPWFDQLRPTDQVILMVVCAALLAISGIWLLRGGQYMVRGFRLLIRLGTNWLVGGAARLRRAFDRDRTNASPRVPLPKRYATPSV
jgi:uncharacterized membrane protein